MVEEAVTAAQLAAQLNVHRETVYLKAKAGQIPGFRVGRSWRFFPSQVRAQLADPTDPWARKR